MSEAIHSSAAMLHDVGALDKATMRDFDAFNRRDFRLAADRFGIDILLPAEAIRRIS